MEGTDAERFGREDGGRIGRRSENIQGSPAIDGPIDMVAFARDTTRRDMQRVAPGSLKVVAPAKVNLFLGVGSAREDGYHEVENVLHAIMLHDVLYMKLTERSDAGAGAGAGAADGPSDAGGPAGAAGPLTISIQCVGYEGISVPDIPPEKNLAYRAVAALARELGRTASEHMDIRIEKHIPFEAGLGGGSSDAAAALVGAARLWGVEDVALLERIAASLGADVPFFLRGGCALYGERGDVFRRSYGTRSDNLVVLKPAVGLSTAAVYCGFDARPSVVPEDARRAAQQAENASELVLFNSLTETAEELEPQLARVRTWASAQPGVHAAMLSGSGSASFAVCESFDAACKVAAAAKLEGWWARTTSFCPLRAAVAGAS